MNKFTKGTARFGATLLTAVLTMSCFSPLATANASIDVRTQSQTQMSSDKEVVYVNTVNNATERTQNFDANWKFYLGDAGNAQTSNFDDSKWRNISLPHDYSIEQEYSKQMEAESGYLPGGTGWYRKHFTVGNELKGKEIRLDFDGVYMNSTVYINGEELGTHPYGYTPFSFDLTDHIKFGEENVIAVKVDHKTPSSRWYSGSGIYRSVNLTVTDAVNVALNGTKVETPELATNQTTVKTTVKTTVENDGKEAKDVVLTHKVFEKGNSKNVIGETTTQKTTIQPNGKADINAEFTVSNPKLWDIESPNLYTVRTEVKVGDKVVDTYDTEYGFRYTKFDKDTGFYLNGKPVKLKGVCMHHDQGALGAVANRRAIERQVEILQEMGCNSIRVTHNPAAQHLIDICNEKGILVVEEIFDGWHHAKNGNTEDFAKYFEKQVGENNKLIGATPTMTWAEFSLKATLKRDCNAPSVIMWSLGNEIQEGNYKSGFLERTPNMIKWAQAVDKTRELTIGSNAVKNEGVNGEHSKIADKITEAGGVSGTNYSDGNSYDRLRNLHPNWKIYGSETASSVNSRGVYHTKDRDNNTQELSSYDTSKVNWGAFASDAWYDVITRDFVAGTYVWTGFDYIGEPTHWNGTNPGVVGKWPSPKNSFFGIVDTAGMPKDSYYLYQSQWNDDVNTLHVLPTWNRDEIILDNQNKAEVVVYSDAPKVELWLTPAGSKEAKKVGEAQELETRTTEKAKHSYQVVKGSNKLYRTWKVPYEAGTLEARAFDANGKPITDTKGRSSVTTAEKEAKLQVKADRNEIKANGTDLSYLQIDVVDAKGNIVPNADDKVKVEVTGNGTLVGLDNGWQTDHDSYKGKERRVYNGSGIAIVQSTKNAGEIKVKVSAEGLGEKTVTLNTTADTTGGEQQVVVDSFFMEKNYYVKVGNKPSLPKTIEVRYSNGTKEQKPVKWNTISDEQTNKAGAFTVKGTVENAGEVSVRVNMIDEVGGLLNYSTAVPVGTTPTLPESRTAYLSNGEVLDVSFPVKWEEKDASAYNKVGTVIVNGTANVLGKEVTVTATVRVAKEDVALGDSISGAAVVLEQDIPENMQSDHLPAIKDGNTGKNANNEGGTNKSVWTNYKNSNEGNDNKAEIIMGYDTQVVLGEIVIHFFEDSYSARFPDANKTKIYVAETKNGPWTQVQAKEQIGTAKDGIKPYTYKLDAPVSATFIKFELTNKDEQLDGRKPCTGITEIELKKATTSFKTNTTAELGKLTVNGVELTKQQLASGKYTTSALVADVTPEAKDNAAVTVLPKNENNQIKIIIESEDHKTTNTFTIFLNDKDPDVYYPNKDITPSAPFSLPSPDAHEGDVRYVLDGDVNTHWHTNWRNGATASDIAKREITLTLKEAATIDAMNYHPRVYGGGNGRVTKYKVLYSVDGTTFNESDVCAEGTISQDKADWTLIEFTKPVKAKAFKLIGVHTYTDQGADKHMAVAELRLRMNRETTDISDEANKVTIDPIAKQKVDVVDEKHPVEPQVTVKQNGKALTYGIDYKVSYADNTKEGAAKAIVTGIGKYSGTLETTFAIEKNPVVLTSIAVKTSPKTDYHVGDTFNPEGLVLSVFYSDNTSSEVAYTAETKDKFTFAPSLETALKETDEVVTVTYEGKTTEVKVNVTEKQESTVRKALEERVKFAQTITSNGYTADSYSAFKAALKAAEETLANENATDAQLQSALDNLNAGINGLKEESVTPNPNPNPNPDENGDRDELRAKLQKFYDECLAYYKEGNYSKDNWKVYEDAMAQAKAALDNENATEKELKDALSDLINATKRLNDEGKAEEQNPPTPPTSIETGDQAPITMIVVLMVVAVVAIVGIVVYKRKKR